MIRFIQALESSLKRNHQGSKAPRFDDSGARDLARKSFSRLVSSCLGGKKLFRQALSFEGAMMPRLSQLMIRTALVWLALGYTIGGLMLLNKGVPLLLWL